MQEIVFVTHNKGKIASAQNSLRDVNFKIYEYELDEPRSEDIRKISEAKVREAYEIVKKPCIALDSGFFIDELGGFPKSLYYDNYDEKITYTSSVINQIFDKDIKTSNKIKEELIKIIMDMEI